MVAYLGILMAKKFAIPSNALGSIQLSVPGVSCRLNTGSAGNS